MFELSMLIAEWLIYCILYLVTAVVPALIGLDAKPACELFGSANLLPLSFYQGGTSDYIESIL